MDISKKIKERRKELGLTMFEVAQKVGVSEATVSRWESGDIVNMRRDKVVSLANALQVTPAFIMGWEDYPFQLKELAEKEIQKRNTMQPIKNLNIRLRQSIENKNIEILELSQKTGIPEKTLNSYLSGRTYPNEDNMYLISKALEISRDWLMGYDVPMTTKYYSNNYELSAEEECIIHIFRNLNKLGQNRLLEYSMELIEISKYKLKTKKHKK